MIRVFFKVTFCEKTSHLSFGAVCFVCHFPNVEAVCSGHRFLLSVEAVCSEHHLSDAEAVCSVCRVSVEAAPVLACNAAFEGRVSVC